MWTNRQFWEQATWRGFRSFCQALSAMLVGTSVNLFTADWHSMVGVAGTAGLVSLLMSIDRERAVVYNTAPAELPEPVPAPEPRRVLRAEPL